MVKERKTALSKIGDAIMKIDLFGEAPSFEINGQSSHKGCCGTIISIIILGIVVNYGIDKGTVMYNNDDTAYVEIIQTNALD